MQLSTHLYLKAVVRLDNEEHNKCSLLAIELVFFVL